MVFPHPRVPEDTGPGRRRGRNRQYLRATLIDELHLAVRPVLMGSGEHLFSGIDMHALGYECAKAVAGERATHVFLRRRA